MSPFDDDEVRWLLQLLDEEQLSEMEVRQGEHHVLVRRELVAAVPPAHPIAVPVATGVPAPAPAPQTQAPVPSGLPVTAPMSGAFYRSPSPDADPFVEVGDRVEVGQVVGLIEAMKLFNEVLCPVSGTITRIVVENQQRVEAEQPLMYVQQALRQE